MNPTIHSMLASEHTADLKRTAARRRLAADDGSPCGPPPREQTIALRVAQPDEGRLVTRLAQLDDAPALDGQVLLAVTDGDAIAALSLQDGRVVANPFVCTTDAVALLRLRYQHLQGARSRRGWRAVLHPRLALR